MAAPTVPQTISPTQANKETPLQEDIRASSHQTVYAYREATSSGLTFGYHAGRWGGFDVAAGTLSLSASNTNYIVVARSTGVISVSTSTTNWNDTAGYARAYRVTTNGSGVTNLYGSDFDYRAGPGGVHGQSGSVGGSGTELRGLTFTSDTGSTAASDPGAGLFKWNNATQGSATAIYIDNQTADGVSLTTLWGALAQTGRIYIQQSTDADRWQQWSYTAHSDGTGYRNFTVTLEAKSTNDIQDDVECYFDLDEDNAGTSGMSTDTLWGAAGDLAYATANDTATRLAIGTARQSLRVNSGATAPEWVSDVTCIPIACSDETTALTTGAAKVTFRMPFAMTLTDVRASLTTAQASGSIFTVDVNESGTTILSTKLTIDNTEKTSTTAVTPRVISDTSLADDAEITIDIDQIGASGATGLKVYLIGYVT